MFHLAPGPVPRAHFVVALVLAVLLPWIIAPRDALASCDPLSNTSLFLDPATIPPGEINHSPGDSLNVHYADDSLGVGASMSFTLGPSQIVGIKIAPSQMIDSTQASRPNVDYFACLDPLTGANNVTFQKAGPYIVRVVRASGPDEWHIIGVGTQALGACFVAGGVPTQFIVPIPPKGYIGADVCAPAYFPVQACYASLALLVAGVAADAAVVGGPVDMVFLDHGGDGEFTVNAIDRVSQRPADAPNFAQFCNTLRGNIKSLRLLSCSSAHGDEGEDFIERLSERMDGIPVTGYTGKVFTWVPAGGIRLWSSAGVPLTRQSSKLLERMNTRTTPSGGPPAASRIAGAASATSSWFFYPNACADVAAGTWAARATPQWDPLDTYAPGGTVPYGTVDHTFGTVPSNWILNPGSALPSTDACAPAKSTASDLQFFGGDPGSKQTIPGAWSSVVSCIFQLPANTASCLAMFDEFADLPHGAGYAAYAEYRVKRGLIWSDWRNMSSPEAARVGIPLAWTSDGYEVAEAAGSSAVQFRYTLRCVSSLATDLANCQAVPIGVVFDNFYLKVTTGVPAPSFNIHPGSLAQSTFVDGTMAGLNCVPAVGAPCWPGIRGTGLGPPPAGINDNVNSPIGDSLIVVIRSGRGLDGTGINWNLGYDKTVAAGLALVWANPAYVPAFNTPMVVYRLFDPTTKTWSPADSSALYPDNVTAIGGVLRVNDSKFRWDWPPADKVAAGAVLPGGFTIKGIAAYAGLAFLPRGTRLQYYFRAVDTSGGVSYQFSSDSRAYEIMDPFPLPGSSLTAPDYVEFDVLPGVYPAGHAGTLIAGKTNTPILNLDAAYTAWSYGYDPVTLALRGLGVRADRYRLLQGVGEGANVGGREQPGQRIERLSNYFPSWAEYAIKDSLATWYRILILPTHLNGNYPSVDEQDAHLIKDWWFTATPGADGGDRCILATGDDTFNTLVNPSPVPAPIAQADQNALALNVFGVGAVAGVWNGSGAIATPAVDDRFSAPASGPALAPAGSYKYVVDGGCSSRFDAVNASGAVPGAANVTTYPTYLAVTNNAAVANTAELDAVGDHDRSKALALGYSIQFIRHGGMRNIDIQTQVLYKFLTACRGPRTGGADVQVCWPCPAPTDKYVNWALQGTAFQTSLYGPLYPIQDGVLAAAAVDESSAPSVVNHLGGNSPNPFNPETVIRFTSAWTGRVEVRIFDVTGRLVQTLAKNVARGANEIRWNGTTSSGGSCASGVYFVKMKFPDGTVSENSLKIAIVR